jgi:hypothetical protein
VICRNWPQAKIWPLSLPTKPLLIAEADLSRCIDRGLLMNFYSLKLYLLSNGFSVETQHIAFWRKKFWVNVFENWVSNLDSSTLAIKIQTKQTVISINIQWVSLLIFRKFWKNEQKGIPKAVSSEFWSLKFEIGQIKFIWSLTMKSERSLVCHLFILV